MKRLEQGVSEAIRGSRQGEAHSPIIEKLCSEKATCIQLLVFSKMTHVLILFSSLESFRVCRRAVSSYRFRVPFFPLEGWGPGRSQVPLPSRSSAAGFPALLLFSVCLVLKHSFPSIKLRTIFLHLPSENMPISQGVDLKHPKPGFSTPALLMPWTRSFFTSVSHPTLGSGPQLQSHGSHAASEVFNEQFPSVLPLISCTSFCGSRCVRGQSGAV